jgi:hypothetical protein
MTVNLLEQVAKPTAGETVGQTVRAILVDPEQQSLTEVELDPHDERRFYQLVGSSTITDGATLIASSSRGWDAVFVNDEPMGFRSSRRFWFQIDVELTPPTSDPLQGRGLVVGFSKDGPHDVHIGIEELRSRITFTQQKYRSDFCSIAAADGQPIEYRR